MKRFIGRLKRPEYSLDSIRIRRVAEEHGAILKLKEAEELWLSYSDTFAAGWLDLPPNDSELWEIINSYLEEEEDTED